MAGNFFLNNLLTYRDRRIKGFAPILRGLPSFYAVCLVGAVANAGIATSCSCKAMPGGFPGSAASWWARSETTRRPPWSPGVIDGEELVNLQKLPAASPKSPLF
jgi:hypothetical protein